MQLPALVQIWHVWQGGLQTQRPQSTGLPQLSWTVPQCPAQVCVTGCETQPHVPHSTGAPQLFVCVPHLPAQVCERESGMQDFFGFLSFFFFFFPSAFA
jgi:hypothetical protein